MNTVLYSERKKYIFKIVIQVMGLGVTYFIFTSVTGLYIPCLFKLATGFKCPGCGITHYALAMIHGNLHEAYQSNQLVFFLVPILLVYGTYRACAFIKKGKTGFSIAESIVLTAILLVTIGFGFYRNIMHI